MGFLTEALGEVRRRLERDPPDASALMALASRMPPTRPFVGALWSAETPALIVEVHSGGELERAVATDAKVIGVNARDLETLEVDVDRALDLLGRVPSDRIAVLESGISTREQVERAVEAGARAVLVGEALMRAADPAAKIRELRGGSG